jgi:hypothetical protein
MVVLPMKDVFTMQTTMTDFFKIVWCDVINIMNDQTAVKLLENHIESIRWYTRD